MSTNASGNGRASTKQVPQAGWRNRTANKALGAEGQRGANHDDTTGDRSLMGNSLVVSPIFHESLIKYIITYTPIMTPRVLQS